MKRKISKINNILKPLKILLIVVIGILSLMLTFKIGEYIYCHTILICDYVRPTMSPEMIATVVAIQYEMAIQDIDMGNYDIARERFKYIIYHNPEYKDARKKLSEVEELLELTPTP